MRVPYLVGLVVTGGAFFALFGTSQSSTHVDKTKVNECSAMQTDWTVACVGDSITLGMRTTPYPTLVAQALLKKGATVTVGNYGVSGATAGTGFAAYTRTDEFKEAILSRPDVVVLMMGTNDGKRKGPVNEAMVDSYFFDGIHPTRRGNELIADIVVDALCRNNLSRKS
ncbi:hypothetical protein DIPPA_26504 [Diplonema papillatum]|nr:hypothetical protein DIPPA_26504 [Diplonema papillatum]